MGTCTFTVNEEGKIKHLPGAVYDTGAEHAFISGVVTMSASYATNGDTLDLSAYITGAPTAVITGGPLSGYAAQWAGGTTAANGKMKLWAAATTEATNAASYATITIPVLVFGKAV